jgi:hypothetical protein
MNLPRVPFLLLVLVLGMCACTPQPQPASSEDTGAPAIVDDFPASLQVVGTEPFWGIRIDGETLLYSTPETIDAPRRLEGTRRVDGDGLHFTGQEGEDAFALDVRRDRVRTGCPISNIPTWPNSCSARRRCRGVRGIRRSRWRRSRASGARERGSPQAVPSVSSR